MLKRTFYIIINNITAKRFVNHVWSETTSLTFSSGHRTLFVGVRMPRQSHRHHKAHGSRHRKRDRRAASNAMQQSEGSDGASSSHGNTHTDNKHLTTFTDCVLPFKTLHMDQCRTCMLAFSPPTEERVAEKHSLSITWPISTCTHTNITAGYN